VRKDADSWCHVDDESRLLKKSQPDLHPFEKQRGSGHPKIQGPKTEFRNRRPGRPAFLCVLILVRLLHREDGAEARLAVDDTLIRLRSLG
jgi:hypothetical protein